MENFEKRCIKNGGEIITVNMTFVLMPDKKRMLVTSRDVTQQRKNEKRINEYMELIDKHTIAATADLEGNYTYVSSGFCNISGYTKNELIGKNHKTMKHPEISIDALIAIKKRVLAGKPWAGEVKNMSKTGQVYWLHSNIACTFDESGNITGFTTISTDITDKKLIEQISITDGLTGIFNRRHFNSIFPKYINSAKRNNDYINFVIMDIDNFKQYNDTYGHQKGDEALISVANSITSSIQRADDICFRLGGEEFGVLFRTKDTDSSIMIAERIRARVEQLQIPHELSTTGKYLTVSIGLMIRLADSIHNTNELYAEADKLLYQAKNNGRNRVEHDIK